MTTNPSLRLVLLLICTLAAILSPLAQMASADPACAPTLQYLKSFGFPVVPNDGAFPTAGVVQASDGALYGTTSGGGSSDAGTVFKLNPDGTGYAVLHNFGSIPNDGLTPFAALVQASDGALYGTTLSGGSSEAGTVFKLNPDGTGYTVLHNFGSIPNDGLTPFAALVQASDGALYGTTLSGGSSGAGTVFKLNPDGIGYMVLYNFGSIPNDGAFPTAGVVQASDGALYGTTSSGGSSGFGTVFKLNPDGTGYEVLYNFGSIPNDGLTPFAALVQASDGALYGTTQLGGSSGFGTVFKMTVTETTPPTLSCPDNIVTLTDPNQCSAVVHYTTATATDNCDPNPTVVCSPASGSTFPKGTTTVTCTATDASGNTATCSFTVTVNDTEEPAISCPADIVQSTDPGQCSAVVNYPPPAATDNCPGVTATCNPPSGSTFPKGTTTVTCTATDAAGNKAACSFNVTVMDMEKPTITCPPDMQVNQDSALGAVVNYPPPTASDNCPGVIVTCTPPSGSVLPLGATTVTCTATDASGNSSSCSFNVTVGPPPSTANAKVIGGGTINVPGGQASFGMVEMTKTAGVPQGNMTYQDHATGMTVKSTEVTAVLVTGTHAQVFGKATINGTGRYDFFIEVNDISDLGAPDTFHIQLSNGYAAGGALTGGNVQVH